MDGSRDERGGGGVEFAGYGIWLGEGDRRDEQAPIPVPERQSLTRAELSAALRALHKQCPGQLLHLVIHSEFVYVGLKGKCENGADTSAWGRRGPLAPVDLWSKLWSRWHLLGDSVSIQWVPSPSVQMRIDANASKGAEIAHQRVLAHRPVTPVTSGNSWG